MSLLSFISWLVYMTPVSYIHFILETPYRTWWQIFYEVLLVVEHNNCYILLTEHLMRHSWFSCLSVDGGWHEWSQWTECTVTCGGGNKERTRTCTNPEPSGGGANCIGNLNETLTCGDDACSSKYVFRELYVCSH